MPLQTPADLRESVDAPPVCKLCVSPRRKQCEDSRRPLSIPARVALFFSVLRKLAAVKRGKRKPRPLKSDAILGQIW